MAIVTIGGVTGSGGRQLGPMVAARLGADYVDRLILTGAAKHIGATVEALYEREQRPPTRGERLSRLMQRILERSAVSGAGGDPYFGPGAVAFLTQEYEDLPQPTITKGHELEDEAYISGLREVIKNLASGGNVVIVGRGGAIILKDTPGVLRVGVVAQLEDRIARIAEREGVDRAQARKLVSDRDKARAYYFKRFFGMENSEDPHLYHLTINTSEVSFEFAADTVVAAAEALGAGRLQAKAAATA